MKRHEQEKANLIRSYLEAEQASYLGEVATMNKAERVFKEAADKAALHKATREDLLLDYQEVLTGVPIIDVPLQGYANEWES